MTEIKEHTPPVYCPIIGNKCMKVYRADFDKWCVDFRMLVMEKNQAIFDYCRVCHGWLPDEKVFVVVNRIDFALPELASAQAEDIRDKTAAVKVEKQGGNMAGKKEKGKCELCLQAGKTLKNYKGMKICSSCMPVLIAVNNRPESVMRALDKFDKLPSARSPLLSSEAIRAAVDNRQVETIDGITLTPGILQKFKNLDRLARRINLFEDFIAEFSQINNQPAG